jgi:hypothetical protein
MCRKTTSLEDQVKCGRCGEVANPTDGWEHGWPLYGEIKIGFPAQAFGALCGMKHIAEPEHFSWWNEGHPAMIDNSAQSVAFEWDCDKEWRLCYECQKELLRVIGNFFKIPHRARALKAEKANN